MGEHRLPPGLHPVYLSRDEAAAFVGVSADVFDAEVAAGIWPPAVRRGARGGKLTWHRPTLEHHAARLAGGCLPPAPANAVAPPPSPTPATAALSPEDLAIAERLGAKNPDRPERRHKKAA